MKKILLALLITATIIGCKKEEEKPVEKPVDYTEFLSQKVSKFLGKIDGESFAWAFGWNLSQGIQGYEIVGDNTPENPVRILLFGLTLESDHNTRFFFYTPTYDTDTEFSELFSVGKKKLGDKGENFYLLAQVNNKKYETNSANSKNEIEILKTLEFKDESGSKLRVWFRIDAELTANDDTKSNLNGGLMIAEFIGYKFQ